MAKNTIIINPPRGYHVRISRRAGEATHEVLASWELGVFAKLLELHITRALIARYGEGICWDWNSQKDWKKLLPCGQTVCITVHTKDEDKDVLVRRLSDMLVGIQEVERVFTNRP
jgi:hypothetical protein